MKEQNIVALSERLRSLAKLVTNGNSVADVGCDHGFVSIYLVQKKISPKVLAMDVRKGPLSRATEHVAEYGLGDYIETRLSDGLTEFIPGEADTLICAGMGGRLMQRILEKQEEKSKSFRELILQPQSELQEFRKFLRENGYVITSENILCEEGKYYFLMKAVPTEYYEAEAEVKNELSEGTIGFSQELFDKYGRQLLLEKNPVLKEFLLERKRLLLEIRDGLNGQDKDRAKVRLGQIEEEIQEITWILEAIS